MSFIKKTNDVHFRHNRCTPTQPLKPPKASRSITPYNAFKSDPERKYGSTELSNVTRNKTMAIAKEAQRNIPKYDTMRTDRRNRLEGLAGYGPSERPGPPRGAPPPAPGSQLPGMKFAKKWEGPLGFEASSNAQKLDRTTLVQNKERVAAIRAQRAKGVRSRTEPSKPLRGRDQSIGGMSPRRTPQGRGRSPRAPRSNSTLSSNGRSPRDVSFTSSGRSQLMGQSRSTTPGNSLDMRGSENSFNAKGARNNSSDKRRNVTLSRGGIAPELNQGVDSLLPMVRSEPSDPSGKRKPTTQKRGQGHKPQLNQVYGDQSTNTNGQPYLSPTILQAASRSPRNQRNSIDGMQTKLFGGHLKDVSNDRWKLVQRDQRAAAMNPETKHNTDMISGVFEMLDTDGSNFIDQVELQRGLKALQLNSTKGAVETFVERADQLDKQNGREHKRGQVGYDTWCDLITKFARGNTIGNMRGAAYDAKHRNFLKRSSHMENVGRGVVDGGLSNMRPGHYTNTALFQSGYSRFNREELFEPNQTEAQREGVSGDKVYEADQQSWVNKNQIKNPKPSQTMENVAKKGDQHKRDLQKKQLENIKKIKELRRRLNQGGNSEEQAAYKWGGENRFHADARMRNEANAMEKADERQRLEEAKLGGNMYASDLFHAKAPPARGKSRTPNVWNKLINPDSDNGYIHY